MHSRNKSVLRHLEQDEHGSLLSHSKDVVDGRFFVAQMIEAVCVFNHSIPRMRSILDDFKTMGETWDSGPSS